MIDIYQLPKLSIDVWYQGKQTQQLIKPPELYSHLHPFTLFFTTGDLDSPAAGGVHCIRETEKRWKARCAQPCLISFFISLSLCLSLSLLFNKVKEGK